MKFYKYILLVSFAIALFSCEENEPMLYDTNYNALNFEVEDSLYLNFMFLPDDAHTAVPYVKLKLMGQPSDNDRTYTVTAVADESTAESGVHYEALKTNYIFPANAIDTRFELAVKRDESLRENTYRLVISLESTKDFEDGIETSKTFIINITDNLIIPPPFWNANYLHYYAGVYHWKKCKKYIEISGADSPKWNPESYAAGDIYIKETRLWFEENPTYDEDGNRLYFENR